MKKTTVTKPEFKKNFAKRLIICLAASVVLGSAALLIYKAHIKNVAKERFDTVENGIQSLSSESINYSAGGESTYNVLISRIGSNMVQWTESGEDEDPAVACRLTDKYGKVVSDSLYKPYLVTMTNSSNSNDFDRSKVYTCHPDVCDKVIDADKKLTKDLPDDGSDLYSSYLGVEKAYIKDNYFYPCLCVFTFDKEDGKIVRVDKRIECFPDDTSGMQLIEKESKIDKHMTSMVLNIGGNNSDLKCEKMIDDFLESGRTLSDGEIEDYKGMFIGRRDVIVQDANSNLQSYPLYIAMPNSLFDKYPLAVVICGAGLLLLAIITAFVSARLSYTKEKANYDIFTARQQTTNAMAHDLKTPLTSIAGYAEMLKEDTDAEKRDHYIEMISRNADQMNSIVSDILALAKSESGAEPLNIQKLCVNDICKAVVSDMEGAFAKRELSCEQDMSETVEVQADEKLLTRALTNLVHNAAVYSKNGSNVKITLNSRSLSIENNMEKVPEKPVSELVKPFVKDSSFRGENAGSGVGLSIAKQDLERMGFRLEISISGDSFTASCKF